MPAAGLVLSGADSRSPLLLSVSPLWSAPGRSAGTRTPLGLCFGKSSAESQDWSVQPPFLRLPLEPHLGSPDSASPSLSDPPGATACRFLERATHCCLWCSGSMEGLVCTLSPQPRCVEPPLRACGYLTSQGLGLPPAHSVSPHGPPWWSPAGSEGVRIQYILLPREAALGLQSRDRKPLLLSNSAH